jgi:two-component sensor histidine kinase
MIDTIPERGNESRVTRWIENLPLTRYGLPFNFVTTLVIVGLAWGARLLLHDALPAGFPYLTFFPAVILTSFLFGSRLGSLSALLCGALAWYYFIPPFNSFTITGNEVALGLYVFVVGTDLALIHEMQKANQQLRQERQLSQNLAAAKAQVAEDLQKRAEERMQAVVALRESEVKTQLATQTAGIGLWQWHIPTGNVHWDNTMFELYGVTPTPEGSVRYLDYISSVHPDDAADQDTVLQRTVAQCAESTREFRIRRGDDGRVRHLRAVEIARAGPDGTTEWVVGTNLDVTEQKSRERHIQLLLGEVNHRSKNLLAVVLSVAKRTSGENHNAFIKNFEARIQSLAAGQDLLVKNEWKGVGLKALISAQLGHYKDLMGDRILLSGDDIPLSSTAVQALGMTIHELVTNASKYGALSADYGRINLDWRRVHGDIGDRFVMTWVESGGPPVAAPTRRGFGSTVTGDMVCASLDAEVVSEFAPSGLSWKLDSPLSAIVEQESA